MTDASQEVINATQQFVLPFGFTQDEAGGIRSAAFMEADFGKKYLLKHVMLEGDIQ